MVSEGHTMKSTGLLMVAGLLATAAAASAQAPAASFDTLAEHIRVGQSIWVTDTQGREVRGRLERLSSDGLVLETNGLETFGAPDVRLVRARDRDSLKNGTLVGVAIGGGLGTAWCIGALADDSGDVDARVECAEGFTVFPGLGALVGLAVDALIPGRVRTVYQAPPGPEPPRARATIVPLFARGTRGVTLALSF
jgi:hypothetical protein